MALFKNSFKPGEMFQDKGVWFIAESSSYQNAGDLEDGFDIFLPGNGVYTVAREATAEEIKAHVGPAPAQREEPVFHSLEVGMRVSYKYNDAVGTVIEVGEKQVRVQVDGSHPQWFGAGTLEVI